MAITPVIQRPSFAENFTGSTGHVVIAPFWAVATTVVDLAKDNKASLLYTVPISLVANAAASLVALVAGAIKLIAVPVFLALAMGSCRNKEVSKHWLTHAWLNAMVGGVAVLSPLGALLNIIAPHLLAAMTEPKPPVSPRIAAEVRTSCAA